MNEYSKELCHWALGKKAKDHKYIAREDGKQKGKYIYFYDISKWKDWKNKAVEATKKAASNFTSNWKEGAGMLKSSAKEYSKVYKEGLPAIKKHYKNEASLTSIKRKASTPSYIAKIKTASGKTRYFYDSKELDNWTRKQRYQLFEPKFMNKIKEIEPDGSGKMPSRKEDVSAVNPAHTKDPRATVNCMLCTTAFDLRKRGYDVSAKPLGSGIRHFFDDLETIHLFKAYNLKTHMVHSKKASSNETLLTQRIINEQVDATHYSLDAKTNIIRNIAPNDALLAIGGIKDDKHATISIAPAEAVSKYAKKRSDNAKIEDKIRSIVEDRSIYGKAIAEAVDDVIRVNPPDSWGRIHLAWELGGGHAIAWEKDSNGQISYIDAQNNCIIKLEEYTMDTDMLYSVNIVRTDNLNLNEGVLDYVVEHKDGEDNLSEYKDYAKR